MLQMPLPHVNLEDGLEEHVRFAVNRATSPGKNVVRTVLCVAWVAAVAALGTIAVAEMESGANKILPETHASSDMTTVERHLSSIGLSISSYINCLGKHNFDGTWCMPASKPSLCTQKPWIMLTDFEAYLRPCPSDSVPDVDTNASLAQDEDDKNTTFTQGIDNDKKAEPLKHANKENQTTGSNAAYSRTAGSVTSVQQYIAKVQAFIQNHKLQDAEEDIPGFVAHHQNDIDDARKETYDKIVNEDFNFTNYQQELQAISAKHDLEEYHSKITEFRQLHLAEIQDFFDAHERARKELKDKVDVVILNGTLNYTRYVTQINELIQDHDIEPYDEKLKDFISTHKSDIESVMAAHHADVAKARDQLSQLVQIGLIDQDEAEIEKRVQKYSRENYQQKIQEFLATHQEMIYHSEMKQNSAVRGLILNLQEAADQQQQQHEKKTRVGN